MPPRKKHYFHGRRRGEIPKEMHGDDLIHQQIRKSKHPFQEMGFISQYTMTPSQKAITCAIKMNNGCASEDFLLGFLQKHWGFIGKMNTKLPNNIPDARILRINLAVKKKGVPLFVRHPTNKEEWLLNTSTEIVSSTKSESELQSKFNEEPTEDETVEIKNYSYKQVFPLNREEIKKIVKMSSGDFESLVLKELELSKRYMTLDEIADKIPSDKKIPGIFENMDHIRRTRAVLIMLKQYGKCKEEKGRWIYSTTTMSTASSAEVLKREDTPCISSLSVSEFYELVKSGRYST